MLHLHDGGVFDPPEVYFQISNDNIVSQTGESSATDGLKIGIDGNGLAIFNQQENIDMVFRTGSVAIGANAERMRITPGGSGDLGIVGICTTNPVATLHVNKIGGSPGVFAFRVDVPTGVPSPFVVRDNGHVGIGTADPQRFVHIHDSTTTYVQFTNYHTIPNPTPFRGFLVGINSTAGTPIAELRQQEAEDMVFFTGDVATGQNAERMRITNDGQIKINSLQCENCFVMTDKEGELYTEKNKITELEARINALENKITQLENIIAINK